MPTIAKSQALWEQSKQHLTGGEGSQGRSSMYPLFIDRASGSHIWDVDGNEYVDFMLGYGPIILGHCHPRVVEAIRQQAGRSMVHGFNHEGEIALSRKVCQAVPGLEQVKFNSTGTEAVNAAVRMARAYTGKTKILKFIGQYHGWTDNLLISGAATSQAQAGERANPGKVLISKGQPSSVLNDVLVAQWNDLEGVERLVRENKNDFAAILTEPMMTNSHVIPAAPGFLAGLKDIAHKYGGLLIFDEVVSGFRVALGGGQSLFGVTPDLSVFGKALGGGVPISCVGGSAKLMAINNKNNAIHLGTFNTNPVAVAAANAVLDELLEGGDALYERMNALGRKLQQGMVDRLNSHGIRVTAQGTDTLFALVFGPDRLTCFPDTFDIDTKLLHRFKQGLFDHGVMVRPETRDIWYLSAAHTEADIDAALAAVADIAAGLGA